MQYLSDEGSTYEIKVDVSGISNLPKGATLDIRPVTGDEYEEYRVKAAEAIGATADQLTYANLLDISILDEDGNEFQPQEGESVIVEIRLLDKEDDSEAQVVHFGGEAEPEVLEAASIGDTVVFATDGFSVYAIVGTGTITVSYLSADGETYEIEVTIPEGSGIPEGSELEVYELTGAVHDSLMADTAEALGKEVNELV